MTPDDAIVAALEASPRPLSFTELTHPYRQATGEWATTANMMGVLARLHVRRRIVRRPVRVDDGSGPVGLDVHQCDFHPAGRDPWPVGVGGVWEAPCARCGQYAASDTGCTRCAADDAAYNARVSAAVKEFS